jgi:DNA-binding GntR family transcriptional regulator
MSAERRASFNAHGVIPNDTTDGLHPPRGRGALAADVCRRLADEIVVGLLPPDTRLDETTLAARFQVSRTPVREALKQLLIMGLVQYRPNRGSVVAAVTPEQLDQMFEAIGELEAACARHAALRMSEPERAELRQLHAEGRLAMQAQDMDRYDALNRSLHQLILQGSHNAVLIDLAVSLRHRIAPFRRSQFRQVERMGESFEEHTDIVEAIVSHDAVGAYRAMRAHLLSARSAASRISPAWSNAATPPPSPSPDRDPA